MAQPTGDEPDFLPDGSLNIHGKRAKKFRVGMSGNKNSSLTSEFPNLEISLSETIKKVNEEIEKAWNNG